MGLFGKKKNTHDLTVSVCHEPDGFSVAAVKRPPSGLPVLSSSLFNPLAAGEDAHPLMVQQLQEYSGRETRCVIVLPVDNYQLIQVEMADIPEAERRDAARWQIRDKIDYPPEEAVLDIFEVAPFGSDKKPMTYVVSAQQQVLREQMPPITEAELSLSSIDVPEFALRNICDLFEDADRGMAILLLLENSGLLAIVRDGTFYLVRLLSTGMNHLLPFVEDGIETLTEQLDAVVLEIQRSFDYCESAFHLPQVSRLLIAQTQQEIPSVTQYLNDFLSTDVESFTFDGVLDVPEGCSQVELNRCLLAIGGALRQEQS